MSDGRTHALATKYTGLGLLAGLALSAAPIWLTKNPTLTDAMVGVTIGAILGHYITPDLDLQNKRTREENFFYRINPVLGMIWQAYWYPYGLLIPHRHFLSHGVPIGTIIRMAYLFAPYWAYYGPFVLENWMVYALLAWCLQDLTHLAQDDWKLF